MQQSTLIIVSCGRSKVWKRHPNHGPEKARNVYKGSLFSVNRAYAEHFSSDWMILSAKYGFLHPDDVIPEDYNVTFEKSQAGAIRDSDLVDQVEQKRLHRFKIVIGLGSYAYREKIESAFSGTSVEMRFPFAGLDMFKLMPAVKSAIKLNDPLSKL